MSNENSIHMMSPQAGASHLFSKSLAGRLAGHLSGRLSKLLMGVLVIGVGASLVGCSSQLPTDASALTSTYSSTATIYVSSPSSTVSTGSTLQFVASGGAAPYTYTLQGSSDSSINAATGLFTAGSTSGAIVILATDAGGSTGYSSITVLGTTTTSSTSQTFTAGNLRLAAGQSVSLSDGSHLSMQADGNLAFYNSAGAIAWSSATDQMNCGSCYANFQSDGNFVLYMNNVAYWASQTVGSKLTVSQAAPYIAITDNSSNTLWSGYNGNGRMTLVQFTPGTLQMAAGQRIPVIGGNFYLVQDGNIAMFSTAGTPYWSSNTGGRACTSGCEVDFQGDGNLVVYQNGTPYWSSGTSGTGYYLQIANSTPFLRILNSSGTLIWTN